MFKGLIKFEWNNTKYLILGTVVSLFAAALFSILPMLLIWVNEKMDESTNLDSKLIGDLLWIIFGMVLIGISCFLLTFLSRWLLSIYSSDRISELRMLLINKISYLSPESIIEYSGNSLNNRLSIDMNNYYMFFSYFCMDIIPAYSRIFIFTAASIIISPPLSLIYIITIPLIFIPSLLYSRYSNKYFIENTINNDNINKITEESITGIRIVKALNLKKRQFKRFFLINKKLYTTGVNADKYTLGVFPYILSFIYSTLGLVILFYGAISKWSFVIADTKMNVGTIIAFSTYSFLVLFAIFESALLNVKKERAKPSIVRIKEILNLKEKIISKSNLVFQNGDIEFKNVSFKFSEKSVENVLTKINIKIPLSTTVGIIGPTGSGKSTLIKMVSRAYDPSTGSITINNKDIKEYNVDSLIDNVSTVFQNKLIFSGTIRENIEFGAKDLSSERLEYISELSQAKEFIFSKKNRYDYVLEQRGSNLSGGQQQRVSIARGLAKDAPILILDDSTSALDNITERKIINALKSLEDKKTLIIIAQRINTIKDIDQIIVLENGAIQGVGTHLQLIRSCKTYQDICKSQDVYDKGGEND